VHSLFGTDGIRQKFGSFPLTQKDLFFLGQAIGDICDNHTLLFIGQDTRESCWAIQESLQEGLLSRGISSVFVGVVPTPVIAWLCQTQGGMGIMISASHNLPEDNGLKFFDSQGHKWSREKEMDLEKRFYQHRGYRSYGTHWEPWSCSLKAKQSSNSLFRDSYLGFLKQKVNPALLQGKTIVVDHAYGATSGWVQPLLEDLGARVIPLFDQPNGQNSNLGCGPLHPEKLCQAVLQFKANWGLAFDGDGDRLLVVDDLGKPVSGDHLLGFLAVHQPRCRGVVGTLLSSYGLELFLKKNHLPFWRSAVGDKAVWEKMQSLDFSLGGEPSGHLLFSSHMPAADALWACLVFAQAMHIENKPVHACFPLFPDVPQVNRSIAVSQKQELLRNPVFQEAIDQGIASLGSEGRLIVRASGTESVLRIFAEGPNPDLLEKVVKHLELCLEKIQLETSP